MLIEFEGKTPVVAGSAFIAPTAVLLGDVPIGRVAFWQGDEIGFFFDPRHWGRGYASEALGRFCAFGFAALGFTQIRADVDPDNVAFLESCSEKIAERGSRYP